MHPTTIIILDSRRNVCLSNYINYAFDRRIPSSMRNLPLFVFLVIVILCLAINLQPFSAHWTASTHLDPSIDAPTAAPSSPILGNVREANSPKSTVTANPIAAADRLKLLIPLYIYPMHYNPATYAWLKIAKAQAQVAITAVINPSNGAIAPPNRDYAQGLKDLRSANVTLLGYVSTRYGDRPIAEVEAEIDLYATAYQVNGIFLDEAASSAEKLDYYQTLSRYIKAKPPLKQVVLNQGTQPDEGYLTRSAADTVIIFENYSKEWAGYQPPLYLSHYDATRFAMLIHSAADAEQMQQAIDLALARHVAYVYVTDDSPEGADTDPWNQLPTYWDAEVSYIQSLNRQAANRQAVSQR
jgi:Spherulation-specific family 4